jgi:hypothetical protein
LETLEVETPHLNLSTEADLENLITTGVVEQRTVEYKRSLPEWNDEAKRELCADICSMANTLGGDIIFGMEAKDGVPVKLVGVGSAVAEKQILCIEQFVQQGIEPRVAGVQCTSVPLAGKGPAIAVRVSRSWRGPHMVRYGKAPAYTYRMFGRNSAGKYPFDTTEIRSAYLAAEETPERIRRWRDGRYAKLVAQEIPVSLASGPRMVLHIAPFRPTQPGTAIDLGQLYDRYADFGLPKQSSMSRRVNLDGVVIFDGGYSGTPPSWQYCHVFRDGSIEAVSTHFFGGDAAPYHLGGEHFEGAIIAIVKTYVEALQRWRIDGPWMVSIAILGGRGTFIGTGRSKHSGGAIDRDVAVFPEVVIQRHDEDFGSALKELLSGIWQAAGHPSSPNYGEDGKFRLHSDSLSARRQNRP